MNNIKVLVVLYNKHIAESITLTSLKAINDIDVYIADNSTIDYGNSKYVYNSNYHYINMQGNKGLSKAYNHVISKFAVTDDIFCLFDDDTEVTSDYFDTLNEYSKQYKDINLFAPIVRDDNGILSPCILKNLKGKRIKKLDEIPENQISVINSGLAIRLKIFDHYKYDEQLFLDYVDHAFIKDIIHNDKSKICILNTIIKQSFSNSQKPNKEIDLKRFDIFKKDITYFCKKYNISSLYREYFLIKRKLTLFLKFLIYSRS